MKVKKCQKMWSFLIGNINDHGSIKESKLNSISEISTVLNHA